MGTRRASWSFRRGILSAGSVLGLFLAVYIPAFVLVGGLRMSLDHAIPAIILVTLAIACLAIAMLVRRNRLHASDFGFAIGETRFLVHAIAFGAPAAALATWLLSHAHEPGPLAGLQIAPWLAYVYFGFGAPIQEEVIFRGLLQSSLARRATANVAESPLQRHAAVVGVAILFAAIHLAVGPVTALCALVLGLIAGELRQQSGSLLPAVLCHALFNLGGLLWASSS